MSLVALIDTAFWPVLQLGFFFLHDEAHSASLRRAVKWVYVGLCAGLLAWVFASALKHAHELSDVLNEFLSTWPAARVTEVLKLMSLWGWLVEHGEPEPKPVPPRKPSLPPTRSQTPTPASLPEDTPRFGEHTDRDSEPSDTAPESGESGPALREGGDLREPLLSAQH